MKKLITLIIILTMAAFLIPTVSAELPHAVWAPLDKFAAAQNAGDDWGMYEYGIQCAEIVEKMPEGQERTNFLGGKYDVIAKSADRMNMMEEACKYYAKYIPFGEKMGWMDGVVLAQRRIIELTPILNYYGESTDVISHAGAKFEPQKGLYFGTTYDNDPRIGIFRNDLIRQHYPKNESVYLMYLEWGDEINQERYQRNFEDAKANNRGIQLAWNTYDQMANIDSQTDYISRTIDFIASYNIPVFLRFACEMNIGPNGGNPEVYKHAFNTVAYYAKSKPSIAMVWAPNDVGAWDRPFKDYYPGDENVDWIGTNSYNIKYFESNRSREHEEPINSYFFTGKWANPLSRLQMITNFMKENNINKPLMLAECGTPHTFPGDGENIEYFGEPLFYRLYCEAPRLYPQIKMMCYFNVDGYKHNDPGDYSLFKNNKWQNLYNDFVSNAYFISTQGGNSPYSYKEINGPVRTEKLSAAFYYPATVNQKIDYYYDGEWKASRTSPYEFTIPQDSGTHTIKADAYVDGKVFRTDTFTVKDGVVMPYDNASAPVSDGGIKVYFNGVLIEFPDTQPQIANDRTLIPVRGVFETMGAEVAWDDETQTATITKGDTVIDITIGSNIMKVNNSDVMLDVPAQTIGYRTMVPLRAISQALGAKVDWDNDTQSAIITL